MPKVIKLNVKIQQVFLNLVHYWTVAIRKKYILYIIYSSRISYSSSYVKIKVIYVTVEYILLKLHPTTHILDPSSPGNG